MKLNLKIPPVAQAVIALGFIWLFDRFAPGYRIDFMHQRSIAWALIGVGGCIGVAGVIAFIKLRTTVDPMHPEKASQLVVVGIYRYSRNPMYLGILLALTGVVFYLGSISGAVVVVLFVVFITKYQIVPEESSLKEKFGEDYSRYARSVRRWI